MDKNYEVISYFCCYQKNVERIYAFIQFFLRKMLLQVPGMDL